MKHPILYRAIFYSSLMVLGVSNILLIFSMNIAPFKSSDMHFAYKAGCYLGTRFTTESTKEKCDISADLYKDTLDDMDRQMEEINGQN